MCEPFNKKIRKFWKTEKTKSARPRCGAFCRCIWCWSGVLVFVSRKALGGVGSFLLLRFLVALALVRGVVFWYQHQKNEIQKKGFKRACFPGPKHRIRKNQRPTPKQFWQNQSLFEFEKNWKRCVIGNKYAKTRIKGVASLVTNGLKGAF